LEVHRYAGGGALEYRNTNPLVRNASPDWSIFLSKTGSLNEAGRCLVMKAGIQGRSLYIVLPDSFGMLTPVGDSNRLREWLQAQRTVQ
jgi:D-alanyl-D-alanine endopeptidase (penicillin-binding protein 7)